MFRGVTFLFIKRGLELCLSKENGLVVCMKNDCVILYSKRGLVWCGIGGLFGTYRNLMDNNFKFGTYFFCKVYKIFISLRMK